MQGTHRRGSRHAKAALACKKERMQCAHRDGHAQPAARAAHVQQLHLHAGGRRAIHAPVLDVDLAAAPGRYLRIHHCACLRHASGMARTVHQHCRTQLWPCACAVRPCSAVHLLEGQGLNVDVVCTARVARLTYIGDHDGDPPLVVVWVAQPALQ